jgi:hypothetical protein
MLYCEINDAYNNNKTYNSLNDETNNEYNTNYTGNFIAKNFNQNSDSDWASVESETTLLPKKLQNKKTKMNDEIVSIDSDINEKTHKYTGTSLTTLSKNKKPTHRECIKTYYNPMSKNNICFDTALKHIVKCDLCKNTISSNSSKKIIKNQNNFSCSSSLNSLINNVCEKNKKSHNDDNKTLIELIKSTSKKKPSIKKTNSDYETTKEDLVSIQSQIEQQSPIEKHIISSNKENEKYQETQETMIKHTIQKYMEDMEEKKELNNKLNKIYELLSLEIKKNEIIEKSFKSHSGFEINYMLIGIIMVIILLIIDIVVRIKN